jgi:SAM-dependent methyltransferase
MNLFDLVNRPDRAVVIESGTAVGRQASVAGAGRRFVELSAGAILRLKNSHELTVLKTLHSDFGWSAISAAADGAGVSVTLEITAPRRESVKLVELRGIKREQAVPLEFRWPANIALAETFDLVIEATGRSAVQLLVGPSVDMRSYVLPYATGAGVEVGPGLRPHVRPSATTDVSYIEQQHPRDWLTMYNHTGEKPAMPPEDILARYRIGSAVELEMIEAGSLDFIFSNHVFEHLANPLLVLRNWLQRLRPGGAILGVIPDPRYTFDCRQPPTTLSEALSEEAAGGYGIARSKYERWCLHTEPRHTPDALIKRGYSIHISYFTPEGFRSVADLLVERGLVARTFIMTAPNNKDFAFALWKAQDAGNATSSAWQQSAAVA